jgi:hypothetical protein
MRYKNFKVLTHKIEDGAAPIQQLAIPHIYNLTVNPDRRRAQCDQSNCVSASVVAGHEPRLGGD